MTGDTDPESDNDDAFALVAPRASGKHGTASGESGLGLVGPAGPAGARSKTVAVTGRWATPARVGGLTGLVSGLVLIAPWLASGPLLVRDLIAVPDPAWTTRLLLESNRLPRDIPAEPLLALVGQVVPAGVVVRIAVVVACMMLGAGVGRLAGAAGSRAAGAVAGVAAVWNPWVWARLQQGQWLALVALATLPWVVIHLWGNRRWRLARVMVIAGLTGFTFVVVVVPTLVVVGVFARRWWATGVGVGVTGLMCLPWLVVTGSLTADPSGFAAYAPSAGLRTGVVASVLTGGGYFNTAIASPARGGWPVAIVAVALALAAVIGAGYWREEPRFLTDWRVRTGLCVVGLAALGFVVFTTEPAVQRLLGQWSVGAPWLAVVRDSHRLLAPWVVVLAIGLGQLAMMAARRWSRAAGFAMVAVGLIVLVLPDPLTGPRLPGPSEIPQSWHLAAQLVNDDDDPGHLLVVPYGQTQRYAFTDGRPVAVPLRRMVGREVMVETRLEVASDEGLMVVDDTAVPDPLRRLAARDMATVTGEDLAVAGVTWVAITDPARFIATTADGVNLALRSPTIQLLEVAPDHVPTGVAPPSRWPLVIDLAVATIAAAVVVAAGASPRR